MFMFGKKKAPQTTSTEWLHQLRSNPSLKFDTATLPSKQSIRILSDDGAVAFASVFCEDAVVSDLTIGGAEMVLGDDQTYLTAAGFTTLGTLIAAHGPVLTDLRLAGHIINFECGIALAEALKNNVGLRNVTLWKCRIDDRTAYEIVSRIIAIPSLEMVNLGQNMLTSQGRGQIEQLVAYSHKPSLVVRMF